MSLAVIISYCILITVGLWRILLLMMGLWVVDRLGFVINRLWLMVDRLRLMVDRFWSIDRFRFVVDRLWLVIDRFWGIDRLWLMVDRGLGIDRSGFMVNWSRMMVCRGRWVVGFLFRVVRGSFIGNLSHIAIVVVSGVLDMLDPAIW